MFTDIPTQLTSPTMSSSDPVKQFDAFLSNSEFLFVVYYRGHWCPFCLSYLRDFSSLSSTLTAAHGTPVIVTAEPEIHLSATRSATGYTGAAIVDPSQLLAKELQRRGLLHIAITEKKGYKDGMAQPAVLVIKRDGAVLESWAIVPKLMNLGGATDRPKLKEIWENVEAKINGGHVVHEIYSSKGVMGLMTEKIFG